MPWIKGECHTNVDEGRTKKWPTVFAKVPDKGETVVCSTGFKLAVLNVAHSMKITKGRALDCVGTHEETREPYIIIELTWCR